MTVGDERGRLGALEIRAEDWLQFDILPFSSLKNKNNTPFYICAQYSAKMFNVEYSIYSL